MRAKAGKVLRNFGGDRARIIAGNFSTRFECFDLVVLVFKNAEMTGIDSENHN